MLRLWHLAVGLKGLRSVSEHPCDAQATECHDKRLVAEAFSQASLPRSQLCRLDPLCRDGTARLWLCVIAAHACTESIAAIVPGKVTRARHADCSEWRLLLEQLSMGKGSGGRGQSGVRGKKGQGHRRRSGLPPARGKFCVPTQRGTGRFPQG